MSSYEILAQWNPWQNSHWFFWGQDFSPAKRHPNADLFQKAANVMQHFVRDYIHIQTNCYVLSKEIHVRWLCCQVKTGSGRHCLHCRWKDGQRNTLWCRQRVAKQGALWSSSQPLHKSQVERLKREVALFLWHRSNKELNTPSPSYHCSTTRDSAFSNSFPEIIRDIYLLYTGLLPL